MSPDQWEKLKKMCRDIVQYSDRQPSHKKRHPVVKELFKFVEEMPLADRPDRVDPSKVAPGLYTVHWVDGGTSLASVGMTESGYRWIAPINWVSPSSSPSAWEGVERLDLVQILTSED